MKAKIGIVTALFALGAVPASAMQQPSQQPASVGRTRITEANEAEILRAVNELRSREARILRELSRTSLTDSVSRRALEQQLAIVSREAFTMMSVIEGRCLEQRSVAPNGYLGVTITTEVEVVDRVARVQRSVVTSVEPGSPAEVAGVRADDRLVSIAGRDARTGFPELADVLQPGRRVAVVVERDDAPREFTVTVAPRPQRMSPACPEFERAMQPLRMGSVARVWVRDTADAEGNRVVTVMPMPSMAPTPPTPPTPRARPYATMPPTPTTAPTPPTPPTPPASGAPMVFMYGVTNGATSEIAYFNGAQFRTLDDDWRGVLGIRSGTDGVLVNEVAAGSAAAISGLKAGDVVLTVDGTAATSPIVVARLLSLSDAPQVSMRVMRSRETRTVTFRRTATPLPRQ
jgi:S1-C subfamily serine protease